MKGGAGRVKKEQEGMEEVEREHEFSANGGVSRDEDGTVKQRVENENEDHELNPNSFWNENEMTFSGQNRKMSFSE